MSEQNNNFNKNKFTPEEILNELTKTVVPFPLAGVTFKITTADLATRIVTYLNNVGITEADHCLLYPVKDKQTGQIMDFDTVIYFVTKPDKNNAEPNITKIGDKNANGGRRGPNGRVNLMPLVNRQSPTGNYDISDKFKRFIGPFAQTNNNNEIIIREHKGNSDIAIVYCNFFKVVAFALGIGSTDNFDFDVTDCVPMSTGQRNEGPMNFMLTIQKEILNERGKKKSKYFNYDSLDRSLVRGRY